jgi:hypothetical protein
LHCLLSDKDGLNGVYQRSDGNGNRKYRFAEQCPKNGDPSGASYRFGFDKKIRIYLLNGSFFSKYEIHLFLKRVLRREACVARSRQTKFEGTVAAVTACPALR